MSDNNQQNKTNERQMNIELPEDISEGKYSNLAIITHSNSEFVIDFVQIMPGMPKAKVKSRIILAPEHANRLYKALGDNLKKYEANHGKLEDSKDFEGFPMNFGGPNPEA